MTTLERLRAMLPRDEMDDGWVLPVSISVSDARKILSVIDAANVLGVQVGRAQLDFSAARDIDYAPLAAALRALGEE